MASFRAIHEGRRFAMPRSQGVAAANTINTPLMPHTPSGQ
jgi:hypothetical protein